VVDDHVAVRDAICRFVKDSCDCVCKAADGFAAIERAKECPPDLVIMDLNMPRLNGLEAAYQIRRLLPETKIIGFSTLSDCSLLPGFDLMLRKQDGFAKLQAAINRLLPS
jgi:DNA-binding NarL/FixJ family response regulator